MKPLRDLICEVKAEVIVEERETDDVEIKVCVVYAVAMAIGFVDHTNETLFSTLQLSENRNKLLVDITKLIRSVCFHYIVFMIVIMLHFSTVLAYY